MDTGTVFHWINAELEGCNHETKKNINIHFFQHLSATFSTTVESVRCRRPTTILRICYSQHVEGPRSNEKMPNPLSLPGQKAASQEVLKIRDASSLLLLHLCQLHKLWVIHSPHSAVIWLSAPKWQACFSIICPSTRLFSMEKMNTCMQECIK